MNYHQKRLFYYFLSVLAIGIISYSFWWKISALFPSYGSWEYAYRTWGNSVIFYFLPQWIALVALILAVSTFWRLGKNLYFLGLFLMVLSIIDYLLLLIPTTLSSDYLPSGFMFLTIWERAIFLILAFLFIRKGFRKAKERTVHQEMILDDLEG